MRQARGTDRAASAAARVGIIKSRLQVGHQAGLALRIAAHQVGLGPPHLLQRLPFGAVVHIGPACALPLACDFFDHCVDRQDLEQSFQPSATQAGLCFDFDHTHGPVCQASEHPLGAQRIGHAGACKVVPDAFVGI